MIVFIVLLEFFCGSLMFSYWLGKLFKKDITAVGDGNPGAFNLIQAVGFKIGLLGVALDFLKGYFPLVYFVEKGYLPKSYIIAGAIAPILGHAFSPFLRFKGGKAIATTFGVWSATTRFRVSLFYAVVLALLFLIAKKLKHGGRTTTEEDAFMVVLGFTIVGAYLYLNNFSVYLLTLWFLNLIIMIYKNKEKLATFYISLTDRQHEIKK
ncbi:glycerol-3-phosphate acyltransferase [Caldicellulosiruptor acetigenus]|uniref:Glycerol-3-phosphate acyltransferase n=1 Tax=Caldicellulosiruptor acetigenus 6A TaxID=632516 RepID=G2PWT7_9FIRM|nr:glycerol-3-phosphate acyltransferase [Caldicellulosiruptor acetigenus]AEM74742.1 Glycerol-3-phosphate acyltransferase [Caldicellulosiruptor acetigenus 6A]